MAFARQRPTLEQLDLVFSYQTKSDKTHKQTSESFPATDIIEKGFYFSIPKRLAASEEPLSIELRNYKGLQVLSVGFFSFPSGRDQDRFQSQLFHCGKPIGEIEISTAIGRRVKNPPSAR